MITHLDKLETVRRGAWEEERTLLCRRVYNASYNSPF
jgi:hypothetical protein